MKRKSFMLFVVVLLIGIITFPAFGAGKYKIAVLPFDDGSIQDRWWGSNWDVGKGVSDEFVTELLKTNRFRVIEREQIKKVLDEQNFGSSGRVDSSSAAKIGKILGVQYLVMGRVTEFGFKSMGGGGISLKHGLGLGVKSTTARVAIDARLVNTTTAEIITSVTGKGSKNNTNVSVAIKWDAIAIGSDEFRKTNLGIALRDAVASASQQLADTAYGSDPSEPENLTATVAYVGGSKVIINIGSGSGIKTGKVLIIEHVISVVKDPATGEVIDQVTEPVAEITVTEVKDKSSTCVIRTMLSSKYKIAVGDKVEEK